MWGSLDPEPWGSLCMTCPVTVGDQAELWSSLVTPTDLVQRGKVPQRLQCCPLGRPALPEPLTRRAQVCGPFSLLNTGGKPCELAHLRAVAPLTPQAGDSTQDDAFGVFLTLPELVPPPWASP